MIFNLWRGPILLIVGLPIAFAPVAASGQSAAVPAPKEKPITVTGERDKPTCRRERSTGSVIPKIVCMTAQQSEEFRQRSMQQKARFAEDAERIREIHMLNEALPE